MRFYRIDPSDARLLGAPDEVDELGSLSLSLDSEWVADRLFVIVTTFIDETGMDGPRVMLAGFTARLHQWHAFSGQWRKLLTRAEIPYSHVLEMKRGDPPFEGWDERKTVAFLKGAAPLISKYCDFGLTVGVDDEIHKRIVAGRPDKTTMDSAYGACARQFFERVPSHVERVMGLRHARLNFVFERHDQRFGDAERIFHELKHVSAYFRERLGTITPGEKEDFPGLQAADCFAYFARRKEPEMGFAPVPTEGPIFAGNKLSPCPLFRVNIGEDAIPLFHQSATEIARRRRGLKSQAKKAAKAPTS